MSVPDWNEQVLERFDVTCVPGMGTMDVDGLNEPAEVSDIVAGGFGVWGLDEPAGVLDAEAEQCEVEGLGFRGR